MSHRKSFREFGIGALLKSSESTHSNISTQNGSLKQLSVDCLSPGKYQPREQITDDALSELASSIRARGVLQPVIVRHSLNDDFEIVAGERRWRAAKLAGLSKIPVSIIDVDDNAAIAIALIENMQREDLNAMEQALGLKRLQDEFEMTQDEVAEVIGKSRSTVANSLRLIKLSPPVQDLLRSGEIEMGHARALLSLSDQAQPVVAREVVAKGMSVRQTEQLVRRMQQHGVDAAISASHRELSPTLLEKQEGFSKLIGANVKIQPGAKGNGKLTITYDSEDDLDRIMSLVSH